MKVLIIGAKGMLGGALVKAFDDLKPVCWDKDDVDITNEEQVREKLEALRQAQGRIDLVVNAAAYTDVDGAETERELAFAVNGVGIKNVARAAKDTGAKMVHYSTDYVFPAFAKASAGKPGLFDEKGEFLGFPENYPPGPAVNVYGESKLAGERALAEAGPEFYLIRTAWLYGFGGKNFVDTMLRLAEEKDSLSVVDDQWGSPTFTKDVAEATRQVVTGEFKPGVYHAVNSGVTTWYGLAKEIFKQAGKEVRVEPVTTDQYPLPARRPKYSGLRNTKGLKMRSWQEALKDYIDNCR